MDPGDTLPFRANLYDEDGGTLVNATTVTLTITLPDGTSNAPTVTNPPSSTGLYLYDYVSSVSGPPGRYVGKWLFTMATGRTTSYVETFDVGQGLVTVDEAQAHLRAGGVITSAADLDQLQWLCFVATDAVERDLDRILVRRTVTEAYNGSQSELILRQTPVIAVTSVTDTGTLYTGGVLDGRYLRRTSGRFLDGWRSVSVVYVAGYLNPPYAARQVALNLVQAMWQESQQASHPFLDESAAQAELPTAIAGLPDPLRRAYDSLRFAGAGVA